MAIKFQLTSLICNIALESIREVNAALVLEKGGTLLSSFAMQILNQWDH
jgi:hypothetical protein